MRFWKLNPINCFGTKESIGKNETHPVAKRNFKFASKGLAIIIIILIILYTMNVIYKAFLLNYLDERFKEYDNWDNYYIEIRSFEEARLTEIRQIWYRDNKYKIIVKTYMDNNEEFIDYKWIDYNTKEVIEVDRANIIRKYNDPYWLDYTYENGKYKNYFFLGERMERQEKNKLMYNFKFASISKKEKETTIKIDDKIIVIESESLLPKSYVDMNEIKKTYRYYNVKLDIVDNEDTTYKKDLLQ